LVLSVQAASHLEPVFEPVIEKAGFKLVRLRIMGGASKTLQVMAERPDGSMDVEGCTALSHALLDFIEAEDPIEGDYEIEVSSPGIDRPLTRPMDFARWAGHEAKIELNIPVEGRRRFRGTLLGMDGQDVAIRADNADFKFPFRAIANAKLVLTDKLINEDLKARDARKPGSVGESRSDPYEETELASTVAANRLELLQIADAVARDKSIDKQVVLTAMEEAMQRAAKAHYGTENDIKVDIDPKTGETHVSRYLHVVELVENDKTEISLPDARRRNPDAQVGDIIAETLPPVDFNRINAQNAKQVIVQKVRDAERERQYDEYKDRIGEVVHGVVKRSEFGSVVVDLGKAEGVVRRDEMIPRESFRAGDRIRAYIYDVRREARGPQIFLSRSHPQFMVRLFAQEVPEIYDGVIEIRAVARDPGSRAKIAVISKDSSIDPVGACVGMRGVRVQAVVQELQGERIDIIPWNPDPATFIVNALAPAEVTKVVLDEDTHRVEVVVPDEQLSLGIGRRGQNVRLASQLTSWQIDILTEAEESERRQKEFAQRTQLFMESLDVDETVAQLLASEGFATIEDVAYVELNELAQIEAFDEETAQELQSRAQEFIEARNKELDDKRRALGVTDDVLDVEGVTPAMAVALGEHEVKTLEDLAGCATDDLIGYYETSKDANGKSGERVRVPGALEGFNLSSDDANAIIMKARVKAGWIEEPVEEEAAEEGGEGEEPAEA
jgi:N utilization substance protein A